MTMPKQNKTNNSHSLLYIQIVFYVKEYFMVYAKWGGGGDS